MYSEYAFLDHKPYDPSLSEIFYFDSLVNKGLTFNPMSTISITLCLDLDGKNVYITLELGINE
jgi:hypothetical protein